MVAYALHQVSRDQLQARRLAVPVGQAAQVVQVAAGIVVVVDDRGDAGRCASSVSITLTTLTTNQ
jgi:hypothetical protein